MRKEDCVTFERVAAQGDLMIIRMPDDFVIPSNYKEVKAKEHYVVAHSETGHHHVVDVENVKYYQDPKDMLTAYLVVEDIIGKAMKHLRSYDTHKPVWLPKGTHKLRRQEEYTPQGWRRVED